VRAAALGWKRPLGEVGRLVGHELRDAAQPGAADVESQVEAVADQVAEHTGAGEHRVEAPRQCLVGMGGVVGEHPDVEGLQPAQRTRGDQVPVPPAPPERAGS
jgi:hypothetical protein